MTGKLGITHRLARLIPAIRRLHDSALDANMRLDQYAQENERLRSFMESESEKIRDFNDDRKILNKQISELKTKESELVSQRELNTGLSGQIKKLERNAARLQDLSRLQDNISANYTTLQEDYNSQQALHAKTLEKLESELSEERELSAESLLKNEGLESKVIEFKDEISNISIELNEQKQSFEDMRLKHFLEVEHVNQENAVKLDSLSRDLEHLEQSKQEVVNRSLKLEGTIQEKTDDVESLSRDLEHSEQRRQEQISRSHELEGVVQEKTGDIDNLRRDLEHSEQRRQEQINRSLELEGAIREKTGDIDNLRRELEHSEQRRQEQINRSLELEGIIQEKTDGLDSLNRDLEHAEQLRQEQINRSLELEGIIQEKTDGLDSLNRDLEHAEQLRQEQINRYHELKGAIQEKTDDLDNLRRDLEHSEQRRQEQISRSLELEGIIQDKTDTLGNFSRDLGHSEKRREEQVSRSLELEGMVQEKSNEIDALKVDVQNIETKRQEQIEKSLFLEKEIQKHVEEKERLQQEVLEANSVVDKFKELQSEVQSLTSELLTKDSQLDELKVNLNDSQHYATIRSEEALARILGKLSQIDHKGSKIPLTTGNVPLSNYSPHELVLGKYFELLIGTLTGTLTEDEPISPWSEGGYDPEVRSLGRDWPATACSMIGTVRMTSLQRLVCDVIENDVKGDAIETGVWRGGACILMKSIFDLYGCEDRKVWVADSFQGLPKPNSDEFENDPEDDPHHTFELLRVSQEQVADNFRKFGALDNNVKFLKGWFKDTLHKAPIKKLAILRLDGDMEESTLQALNALYHKVSKGGYVIIDDYGLGPCRKAVDAFRLERGIENPLFEVDAACVYWQV